jgi:acyl-CoA dehydrogenase
MITDTTTRPDVAELTARTRTFGREQVLPDDDRSMQLCGGAGVSDDLPIARIFREVRPFRISDGPSEVHRWAIARRAVSRALQEAGRG